MKAKGKAKCAICGKWRARRNMGPVPSEAKAKFDFYTQEDLFCAECLQWMRRKAAEG